MLANGRPILTAAVADATFSTVDQMVVSVGPYRFQSVRFWAAIGRPRGDLMPRPHTMPAIAGHPPSLNRATFAKLPAWPEIRLDWCGPGAARVAWRSRAASRLATISWPPASKGRRISAAAMSKASVLTASRESWPENPGR